MNFLHPERYALQERIEFSKKIKTLKGDLSYLHDSVKQVGFSHEMDDYERRKLSIFNQLNFFQLITGLAVPLMGLFNNKQYPEWAFLVAALPSLTSLVVLWLNAQKNYEYGQIFYFLVYPVITSIVYMNGINTGSELFFILYGVLAVFFLKDLSQMLFTVGLSMISYFMLGVVLKSHRYQLESSHLFIYWFNELTAIVFIFYGLFLIKKENAGYQTNILDKNKAIAEREIILQQQTKELSELNAVKNKLFSVIAHDLKTPMYSTRNLFNTIHQQKIPAREIRALLPDVINNLDYTTALMDNLLNWAKSQMHNSSPDLKQLDIHKIIFGVVNTAQLQAAAKHITIQISNNESVFVTADKNMIELVIRNLLSNAIKFTPAGGNIFITVRQHTSNIEISVKDSGKGMDEATLQKLQLNNFYSTNGTNHEPGTGLGLMLCREFLAKNNSQLCIKSESGTGSTFSFLLD